MTKEVFLNLDPDTTVIDIREPEELETVPSPEGAVNVPMSTIADGDGVSKIPKERAVVAVCAGGGRCQALMEKLNPEGYNIDYLEGGLNGLNK